MSPRNPAAADRLRAIVTEDARNRPGVYRFIGPKGEVLYVGKSVRVRTRLLSYFRADVPVKLRELLRVATGVEWEYVDNHFEAVIREFRQIKAFQPRFNRQYRRDRRFAWIRVTDEPAARLVGSRGPPTNGHARFGPFPAGRRLPSVLRELATAGGLRDCPSATPMSFVDQGDLFGRADIPRCPRGDLGTCPAPCAGRCSIPEYRERVDGVVRFLRGQDDSILETLVAKMDRAATAREFELAARLRDREERLRALRDRVVSFAALLDDLSFVYRIPPEHEEASRNDRGYVILRGRVLQSFVFEKDERWKEGVRSALGRAPTPGVCVDPVEREEAFLVARWFIHRPDERERTESFDDALRG